MVLVSVVSYFGALVSGEDGISTFGVQSTDFYNNTNWQKFT